METQLAFIDFETTGLSPESGDRIIEVGVAILSSGQIIDRYQSLVNPRRRIPFEVEGLTGISNSMVSNAPTAACVMNELIAFIDHRPLVAHNASFDRRFFDCELNRMDLRRKNEFICSLRVARRVYPEAPNHKLATLVRLAQVEPADEFHRALADAEMTARLWAHMVKDIRRNHGIDSVPLELMRMLQTCRVAGAGEAIEQFA